VIKDYKKVIEQICRSFHPTFIFISGVPSGENVDYVGLLLMGGEKGIPCYLFNEKNLIEFIQSQGYLLMDKFMEDIRLNLSNFTESQFHLDSNKENYVKGYIFIKDGASVL
jgi:hypothetical protein